MLLVGVWASIALIGRSQHEADYAARKPLVTAVLVGCLLVGAALTVAVPTVAAISVFNDSVGGKLISAAAVLVGAIAIAISIWWLFPYGLGK
jgi:hypothetical protein